MFKGRGQMKCRPGGFSTIEHVICAALVIAALFVPFGESGKSAVDQLLSAFRGRYEAQSYAISHPMIGSPKSL